MPSTKSLLLFGTGEVDSIDAEAGIIKGVSLITEGEVIGHDCFADAKTNSSVLECCNKVEKVKVKLNHNSDAGTVVGVLENFRIDGSQVKADLHLLKNSSYYNYILELAEKLSGHFGLSIAFKPTFETNNKKKFVRCERIYSADIVDAPAANPKGLFAENDKMESTEITPETVPSKKELDTAGLAGLPAGSAGPITGVGGDIKSSEVSTSCPECQKTSEVLGSLNELHNTATSLIAEHKERMLRQASDISGLQDSLATANTTIAELKAQLEALTTEFAAVKDAAHKVELMSSAVDTVGNRVDTALAELDAKLATSIETAKSEATAAFEQKLTAQKEEFEAKIADTDIVAQRKLAKIGVDIKTIPSADATTSVVNILETLNTIVNPLEKAAFYREHKQEIFKAQQAEINKRQAQLAEHSQSAF